MPRVKSLFSIIEGLNVPELAIALATLDSYTEQFIKENKIEVIHSSSTTVVTGMYVVVRDLAYDEPIKIGSE